MHKLASIFIFIVMAAHIACSASGQDSTKQFGETTEVKIKETVIFEDSLSVTMRAANHKHTIDGDTHGFAYVIFNQGEESKEVRFGSFDIGKTKKLSFSSDNQGTKAKEYEIIVGEVGNSNVFLTISPADLQIEEK